MTPELHEEYERLHAQARPKILAYLRRRVVTVQDAENITQDVFRDAWVSFETYKSSYPFDLWVRGFATNALGAYYSQLGRDRHAFRDPETLKALDQTAQSMDIPSNLDLARCMEQFSDEDTALLYEICAHGRKFSYYAPSGCPDYYRFRSHFSRLKKALIKCLAKGDSDHESSK